jgi:hypothetical protein
LNAQPPGCFGNESGCGTAVRLEGEAPAACDSPEIRRDALQVCGYDLQADYARILSYLPRSLPGSASILPAAQGLGPLQDADFVRPGDGILAGGNAQFPVGGLGVGLDRVQRQVEFLADLA